MSATKFVVLQCLVFLITFGLWLGSDHSMFLFIAGIAFGTAVMGAVIGWEERKSIAAEIQRRLGA